MTLMSTTKYILSILLALTVAGGYSEPVYWTADGQQRSFNLPDSESLKLVVPAEAVAVDLRSLPAGGEGFTLDASQANANCLYYVDADCQLAGLPQQNVVCNGVAEEVVLGDESDFYCPVGFTATDILLRVTPRRDDGQTGSASTPYYDTLVLPFDSDGFLPTAINAAVGQPWVEVWVLSSFADGLLEFLSVEAGCLQASVPYLMKYDADIAQAPILFYGQDKYVSATAEARVDADDVSFVGRTMAAVPGMNYFRLQRDDTPCFVLADGNVSIEAFRCIIEPNPSAEAFSTNAVSLEIVFGDAMPSALPVACRQESVDRAVVWSLAGQRRRGLQRGLNVVRGRKLLVR